MTLPRWAVRAAAWAARCVRALTCCAALGCSGGGGAPSPLRVVLLADSHVIGPQYVCCTENGDLDNESIVRTVERLAAARDKINAIRPRPDLAVVLGDVTHDGYVFPDFDSYAATETAFSRAAALYAGFEIPVYFVWGNHDYSVDCSGADSFSRDFSAKLFDEFFHQPPYQVITEKGWKLILANGMLGPTWEPGNKLCDTGMSSYGDTQLAWTESQIAEGLPTLVLTHHTLLVNQLDEDPGTSHPDLLSLVARNVNVKHTFAGHTHRWIPLSGYYGFGHTLIGATRYDDDNFTLLELDARTGEVAQLDAGKAKVPTTCAFTWSYDGTPRLVDGAPETGTCGVL